MLLVVCQLSRELGRKTLSVWTFGQHRALEIGIPFNFQLQTVFTLEDTNLCTIYCLLETGYSDLGRNTPCFYLV